MTNEPIDRRRFLAHGAIATAALAGLGISACAGRSTSGDLDVVVRGGTVFDGGGKPGFEADVGIRDGRVTELGAIDRSRGRRVIEARGSCVAPGFIDIHTHSDNSIFEWPTADSRIRQGCTTEVTGNCGGSAAPRDPAHADDDDEDSIHVHWTDMKSYVEAWKANAPALNQAMLIGHGTLRRAVIGEVDRRATAAELAEMTRRLEAALEAGALGLSTGLEYVPGIYAPPEEIETLARVVARRGGLYATHMRSEEEKLIEAIDEALAVSRSTGVRLQISHLKACGRGNWKLQDAAIRRIEKARSTGLDVMADAYPYTAYSTTLTILLENWSREGGGAAVVRRLQDPATRARMKSELAPHVERDPGAFDLIVISSADGPGLEPCIGKSLVQIAEMWNVDPAEATLRLLEAAKADVGYVGHGMSEENVERVLALPWVMISSDGRSMAPTGSAIGKRPHPRSYGTFPRVLGHYCRDRRLFDLPTAVRKMTGMPAERARLSGRGSIAVGAAADLVVFDGSTIADGATFEDPQSYPIGLTHVLVNGLVVVDGGRPTGARPGQWL